MHELLRIFRRSESGNVAMLVGFALVPLVGAAGLSLDYSLASAQRSEIQNAADAAALAGALSPDPSSTGRIAAATRVFNASAPKNVSVSLDVQPSGNTVVVTASAQVPTTMLKVLQITKISVGVRAKAVQDQNGATACIVALATSGTGIDISGSASVTAKNCALYSNSSASDAISIGGSSTVSAAGYCAVGSVSAPSNLTPKPEPGCPAVSDPFAGKPVPSNTACDASKKNVSIKPKETVTLDPGVYCGGLDIKGKATLKSGLYVIKDGGLTVNSSADVTGNGVTFYLTGTGATFDINGGGDVTLSAMTTGDYADILLIQDRTSAVNATSKINGDSSMKLKGSIYAPTQNITMNGNGTFGQNSPYMPLVAQTIKITGNNTTQVEADLTTTSTPPNLPKMPSGAHLTE